MTRLTTIMILLLFLVATPASAAPVPGGQLAISLSLQSQVWHGAGQSYHVKIEPTGKPVGSVYVLWFIHGDTSIIGTNHTDGLDCDTFEQVPVMITCSTSLLTDTQMISIHGTVTGPGDAGHYAIVRVGTADNGSHNQGWALWAEYQERGGTIPSALAPGVEPVNSVVYLPTVRK